MGKQATSHARRFVAREGTTRRARGPPVRYRDKPDPTPQRGAFCMPIRGAFCAPIDNRPHIHISIGLLVNLRRRAIASSIRCGHFWGLITELTNR